jgi:hypothetical protein
MAKYKILVIKHLLIGNRMASSGDIVDESQFINLQTSVNGGYCVKVKKDKKDNKVEDTEVQNFKKMSKIELLAFAAENEIDIPNEANKPEILEIITNSQS